MMKLEEFKKVAEGQLQTCLCSDDLISGFARGFLLGTKLALTAVVNGIAVGLEDAGSWQEVSAWRDLRGWIDKYEQTARFYRVAYTCRGKGIIPKLYCFAGGKVVHSKEYCENEQELAEQAGKEWLEGK